MFKKWNRINLLINCFYNSCGLAAVSMAINMLETDSEEKNYVEELLQLAINMNITKQGEMFSGSINGVLILKNLFRSK